MTEILFETVHLNIFLEVEENFRSICVNRKEMLVVPEN